MPVPALALITAGPVLFPLPAYDVIRRVIRVWVAAAGIAKKITFHCARHTFATLQITYGTDIYVVSRLLGHQDIRTTQVYARLIDARKDAAMAKLDHIKIPGE